MPAKKPRVTTGRKNCETKAVSWASFNDSRIRVLQKNSIFQKLQITKTCTLMKQREVVEESWSFSSYFCFLREKFFRNSQFQKEYAFLLKKAPGYSRRICAEKLFESDEISSSNFLNLPNLIVLWFFSQNNVYIRRKLTFFKNGII